MLPGFDRSAGARFRLEVTPSGKLSWPPGIGQSRLRLVSPDFFAMFSTGNQVRLDSSSFLIESTIPPSSLPRKEKGVVSNGHGVLLSKEQKTLRHCNLANQSATILSR